MSFQHPDLERLLGIRCRELKDAWTNGREGASRKNKLVRARTPITLAKVFIGTREGSIIGKGTFVALQPSYPCREADDR